MKREYQNTLYWHDYETWGEVPSIDRPSQFAGIRTDEDLNIIGEPLMIYCKPSADVLPKPDACLITGIPPQLAMEKGLPEYQFAARIHAELSQPGTCGVGYNSIRFDDEVTRFLLYRNFYDPYEREWRNGNSRWDIIDMVRMARALRPDGIEWPNYDDGRSCFKLELLTKANGLLHEAAHDALSDVYATIAVAKLIKTAQPKLYDYAYKLRDKRFVASLIDIAAGKPLLHISSRFPAEHGNAALVLPLAIHPTNKNSVIAFNLATDPTALLSLSVAELSLRLFTRTEDLPDGVERLALKEIHLNKTPMLLPANALDDATASRLRIDKDLCERHWYRLRSLTLTEQTHLQQTLHALYSEKSFQEKADPEQMLYQGFFDDHDKRLIARVRQASMELLTQPFDFHDPRLTELLFRYKARNFPEALNGEEQERWKKFCQWRLADKQSESSLTLMEFHARLSELALDADLTERQRSLLKHLRAYADSLITER